MIPKKAKKLDHTILAEGEATGHAHRATGSAVELYEFNGGIILKAPDGATVTHEEHATVALEGVFDVRRVQEFDFFSEQGRNVMD